jgi:P22_AR N-terminal domain
VSQLDFYGEGLMVLLVEIGGECQILVPLRQFCQYLGIDWASQCQRTKRDEILAREMAAVVITTAGPGQYSGQQRHPVICLPLDLLLGWLFTISPNEGEEYFMDDEENRERLDQPGAEADEATDQQTLVPTAVRQVRNPRAEG